MRVFIAGATGAIGKRLVPLLVASGHEVTAASTSKEKGDALRAVGAEPVVMDGLERDVVMNVVKQARPEAIVHQMTALASMRSLKNFDQDFALTNRLRTEGTEHLLEAARAVGVKKFVAQSFTGWPNIREGGRVKTEADPLDPNPPKGMTNTLAAIKKLESLVSKAPDIAGTVLRFGSLYGPGTSIAIDGDIAQLVRQRKLPLVGSAAGVWSFIHVDDAANATQLALERGIPEIYNIVDDDPAEVSVWLPELARILGAKAPHHLPAWLAKFALGEPGLSVMTKIRGSSNAKAKSELDWRPKYTSWREGFRNGLSAESPGDQVTNYARR